MRFRIVPSQSRVQWDILEERDGRWTRAGCGELYSCLLQVKQRTGVSYAAGGA